MRIVCVLPNVGVGGGGAERQLVSLGVLFRRRGHEVRFLTYHTAGFYLELLKQNGIPVQCLNEPDPRKQRALIRKALRTGVQDVVVAFLEEPCYFVESAALPTRRWGVISGEESAFEDRLASPQGRALRRYHRAADWIVPNSHEGRRLIAKHYPKLAPKLRTIYNAIDLELFSPSPDYVPRADGRTKLIVAASYRIMKNMKGLVQAVGLLSEAERERLQVDWYGTQAVNRDSAALYEEAAALIESLGVGECIRLNDATDRIAELTKATDAVGLFSFYEGLPNAICEGMACAKPVIMSDVSDARILVDPGVNGFLCDPHNPPSIAEALRALLSAPSEMLVEMGRRNRAKALELFDPEKIADEFLAAMTSAAAARQPSRVRRAAGRDPFAPAVSNKPVRFDAATYEYEGQWGSYGEGEGKWRGQAGLAWAPVERCWLLADYIAHCVQKFSAEGIFLGWLGRNRHNITGWHYPNDQGGYALPGSDEGCFLMPTDVAVSADGGCYVADLHNFRIQQFAMSGSFVREWGSAGSGEGEFNEPWAVELDGVGNVYVAERVNGRIQKFTAEGEFLASWGVRGVGDGGLAAPCGLAIAAGGEVYVADAGSNRICVFTDEGAFIGWFGGDDRGGAGWHEPGSAVFPAAGSAPGQFNRPVAAAVDPVGNLYVADFGNRRVQKFGARREFMTEWGMAGPRRARLAGPCGLVADVQGYVHVLDHDGSVGASVKRYRPRA